MSADDITSILKLEFDCRPGALAVSLALREPTYQESAAYCHSGRPPCIKDGRKFFEWENAMDMKKYANMSGDVWRDCAQNSGHSTMCPERERQHCFR